MRKAHWTWEDENLLSPHWPSCPYRIKESSGWQQVFSSPYLDWTIERIALNAKVVGGPHGDKDKMVAAASESSIILWSIQDGGSGNEIGQFDRQENEEARVNLAKCKPVSDHRVPAAPGVFSLGVPVDDLFFIGNQLVATSHTGKVGVWNAVTQHWQAGGPWHWNRPAAKVSVLILSFVLGSRRGSHHQLWHSRILPPTGLQQRLDLLHRCIRTGSTFFHQSVTLLWSLMLWPVSYFRHAEVSSEDEGQRSSGDRALSWPFKWRNHCTVCLPHTKNQ